MITLRGSEVQSASKGRATALLIALARSSSSGSSGSDAGRSGSGPRVAPCSKAIDMLKRQATSRNTQARCSGEGSRCSSSITKPSSPATAAAMRREITSRCEP